MYIQYKVNVSENQVDTLRDVIRLKKGEPRCIPKGGIRGDRVLLLTPAQISRLDKVQVERRRVQICLSVRQVAKDVRCTGGFIGMLAQLATLAIPSLPVYYLQSCRDLQLVYFLVVLTKQLVAVVLLEKDSTLPSTEMPRQWSLSSSTSTFC